jgi:hypothetical protein
MVVSAARMIAPAGLTLLAIQTGGWGWWLIAALFAGCAFVAGPAVAWVTRTPRVGQAPSAPSATVAEALA